MSERPLIGCIEAVGVLERIDPEGALADAIGGIGVNEAVATGAWDVPLELTMELRVLSVRAALADLWRGVRVRQSFVRELAQAAGRWSNHAVFAQRPYGILAQVGA